MTPCVIVTPAVTDVDRLFASVNTSVHEPAPTAVTVNEAGFGAEVGLTLTTCVCR